MSTSGSDLGTEAFAAVLTDLPGWVKLHDHSTATTWQKLRVASDAAQQAIRAADAQHYQQLAQRAATMQSVEGLNGLWKQLRAILPKHRTKRHQAPRDIENELQETLRLLKLAPRLQRLSLQLIACSATFRNDINMLGIYIFNCMTYQRSLRLRAFVSNKSPAKLLDQTVFLLTCVDKEQSL